MTRLSLAIFRPSLDQVYPSGARRSLLVSQSEQSLHERRLRRTPSSTTHLLSRNEPHGDRRLQLSLPYKITCVSSEFNNHFRLSVDSAVLRKLVPVYIPNKLRIVCVVTSVSFFARLLVAFCRSSDRRCWTSTTAHFTTVFSIRRGQDEGSA